MSFLHPTLALFAGAAVALPVIIHLLMRRRRKPVRWAAMRFLLEAMRRQRRRLRLETLILLAVRCLALVCIGGAIARPMFEKAGLLGMGGGGGRDVYLLIDNGLASSAKDSAGVSALDRHKAEAKALIDSLSPGDRVGLAPLASPVELTVVPASSDAHAVRELVDSLVASDGATDLPGGLDRLGAKLGKSSAEDAAGVDRATTVAVLSDFFDGSADLARPLPAALAGVRRFSIVASRPGTPPGLNVQVTGVKALRSVMIAAPAGIVNGKGAASATSSGESQQARVTLRRTGPDVARESVSTVRVRLGAGNTGPQASAQAVVHWTPGQSDGAATVQLDPSSAQPGTGSGGAGHGQDAVLVAEIDRDSVAADNAWRTSIEVRGALHVGVVAQRGFGSGGSGAGAGGAVDSLPSAEWLRLALHPGDESALDVMDLEPSSLDASTLALVDAVMIPAPDQVPPEAWTRLRRFADAGGLVVVSPPEGASVHLWADVMIKALDLPWRVGREAVSAPADRPQRLVEPAGASTVNAPGATVFALIGPELKQLVRPVGIFKWLNVEDTRPGTHPLLALENGGAWLVAARAGSGEVRTGGDEGAAPTPEQSRQGAAADNQGRGLVVLLASAPALSWTDLPARPLMVPLIQELVRQGLGEAGVLGGAVAGRPVSVPTGVAELRPMGEEGDRASGVHAIRVSESGATTVPIRSAGVWSAVDAAGRPRGVVVVNADADAGRLGAQVPDAVASWLSGAGAPGGQVIWLDSAKPSLAPGEARRGAPPLTLPLLAAGLALVLLEVFLARFFSHALADKGPSASSPIAGAGAPA